MSAPLPEIWLGDLLTALSEVGGGPETDRRIAELLGLVAAPADPGAGSYPAGAAAAVADGDDASEGPEDLADLSADGADAPSTHWMTLLTESRREPLPSTDWEPVESLASASPAGPAAPVEAQPLLAPRAVRTVLHAALATSGNADGPPDVEALVETFAKGMPCTRLPRLPRPTLRFGVQVLLDVGEAMEPFAQDQRGLADEITALVGPEHTDVRRFADSPLRGAGPGPRRGWSAYAPPNPGARVLIVSDLGAGGPPLNPRQSTVTEWITLIDTIGRAGCTALALVPYPPSRLPPVLRGRLPVLGWDRHTTASSVVVALARR